MILIMLIHWSFFPWNSVLKDIKASFKNFLDWCMDPGISHKSIKGEFSFQPPFFRLHVTFSGRPFLVIKTGLSHMVYTLIVPVCFLSRIYHFRNYTIKCVLLSYRPSLTTQFHEIRDRAYFINLFLAFAGSQSSLWKGGKERKKPLLGTSGPTLSNYPR